MDKRHLDRRNLPRLWLFTDARNDATLERAIERLPRGSGIVFRHYHLKADARRERFDAVARTARGRHLILLSDTPRRARRWGADGVYSSEGQLRRTDGRRLVVAMPAHDVRELNAAKRRGADLAFLSPIYGTRSHPGSLPMAPIERHRLIERSPVPIILLGGMTRRCAIALRRLGAHGWGAIDGLS